MKQATFVFEVRILQKQLFHFYTNVAVIFAHPFNSELRRWGFESEAKKPLLKALIIQIKGTEISNVVRVTVLKCAGYNAVHLVDVKVTLGVLRVD